MRTCRVRSTVQVLCLALVLSWVGSVKAADDNWPCEVVLCMANPKGPTALKECEPPIKKAWKAWSKGKRVPECKRKNQDGSDGGDLRQSGHYIDHEYANPDDPARCPFAYYAGHQRLRYCAFVGVTNQYINGQLWGRIWYGGPGGRTYIEMLHVDPNNPRPSDGFEDAWAALKTHIEDKADYAAIAHKIWMDSEARAVDAEKDAAKAAAEAAEAASQVAFFEAWLPGELADANATYSTANDAYIAAYPAYEAAKAAASKPSASPAEIAAFQALEGPTMTKYWLMVAASNRVNLATTNIAALPAWRANATSLQEAAAVAQTNANEKRSIAIKDKADFLAAEEAAKPLLEPFWGGD
jgi:hypothetical protein